MRIKIPPNKIKKGGGWWKRSLQIPSSC